MEQNVPSQKQLVQELNELRSRVRQLERLDQEQRRALEELRIRDERFRAIIEFSPLAIVSIDLEGSVTLWNSAAERMFGWSAEEVLGKPLPYVTEEMREGHIALRKRVSSGESFSGVEVRRCTKDGSPIDISVSAFPLVESTGTIYGIFSMNMDITESKHLREEVAAEKAFSDSIINSLPGLFYLFDQTGRMKRWNHNLEVQSGYSFEEISRMNALQFVSQESTESSARAIEEVFDRGESQVEATFLSKDGKRTPCLFTGKRVFLDGSWFLSGMAIEMSERKEAEKALRRSEELLSKSQAIGHIGSWELDLSANRLTWSDEVYRIFGVRSQEFTASYDAFFEAVHPEDREAVKAAYWGSIREDSGTYEIEHRIIRGDSGEVRFVVEKCEHVRDAAGSIVRSIGMVQDITERKRTEAALHESEERMSQALRAANAGAWEWRMQTNEAIWSDENYLVLGLEPGSMKSCYENWLKTVHPEDRAEADRLVTEAVQNRSELDISFRVVWPDGSIHWINDRGKLVYDGSGEPIGMYGIQIDISERKRAEEALRASEEKYRSIVVQTAEWIWEVDRNGVHTFSNPTIAFILGYRPEEFIGLRANSFLHSDDRTEVEARLPQLMREKHGWRGWILRWRHKDGSYRFLESNADPILDSTGELLGYRGTDRDITERMLAQEALRQKEEYYRSLFENAMDIVTILGPDGIILFESPSVERIVGYKPEELVGRDVFALIHPEDAGPTRELFGRLVRTPGSVETVEFRFRHRDGSWRTLEAIGKNLLQLPAVRAVVVNERDVTDRRNAEVQLRISLQQKETLIKEIHHRVKNNLQVISSLLDLESQSVKTSEGIEALRDSKQRVKTMAMIHEKLYIMEDFSSIVLSDYIKDLVQDIVQMNRPDGSVAIQCDVPAIPLSVNAAVPCGLIVTELVSNCLKHAFTEGQKGNILIYLRSLGEKRLALLVEDDGRGLPEDVGFDKGGALGLTLVRTLVKQLDGSIEIQRGTGTCFRITFSDKS